MRRPRGGALEQNEQKPENSSRALPIEPIFRRIRVKSGELVEIYPIYVSTKTFLKNSDLIFFDVNQSSNLGQIWPIWVKSSRLVKISQINMFRLRMFSGIEIQYSLRSNQVIKIVFIYMYVHTDKLFFRFLDFGLGLAERNFHRIRKK